MIIGSIFILGHLQEKYLRKETGFYLDSEKVFGQISVNVVW